LDDAEPFVLPSEFCCENCNNKLGNLDDQFLFWRPTMWSAAAAGVKKRKGSGRHWRRGDADSAAGASASFEETRYTFDTLPGAQDMKDKLASIIRTEMGVDPRQVEFQPGTMSGSARIPVVDGSIAAGTEARVDFNSRKFKEQLLVQALHKVGLSAAWWCHLNRSYSIPGGRLGLETMREFVVDPTGGGEWAYALGVNRGGPVWLDACAFEGLTLVAVGLRDHVFVVASEPHLADLFDTVARAHPEMQLRLYRGIQNWTVENHM